MADIAITAANFKPSALAIIKKGLAKGTIARGRPIRFDTSLGGYVAAAANNLGGAAVEGWCMEDVGTGQYFLFVKQDDALDIGGTVAAGDTVWLSATGITKTFADLASGWVVVVLGVGLGGGNIVKSRILQGAAIP